MKSIEHKFKKDPTTASKYKETMKAYINRGHATKLTPEEASNIKPFTNYDPHHAVSNINKPNKIRVVFYATAEYPNSSLNKHLLKGTDLSNKLIAILLHFQNRKYYVMADIRQMFYQVFVIPEDRDALSFIWRESEKEKNS